MMYLWPGNVRELRNVIQHTSFFAEKEIKLADLPDDNRDIDHLGQLMKACHASFDSGNMTYDAVIQCLEARLLKDALKNANGNQSEAARKLGIKLSTFRDKLKKLEACQTHA